MTLQQYWTQPSPETHRSDLRPGLEARVQDPLWLLLRQWQTGEFQGEDAGTPILAECERDLFAIDRVKLDGQTQPYLGAELPLEAIVERETKEQVVPDLRTRAQHGQMFLRMIDQAGLALDAAAFRALMAFTPGEFADEIARDPAARMLARMAPDARVIYAAMAPAPGDDKSLAQLLPGSKLPYQPYRDLIAAWIARYEARVGKPGEADAWIEDRLEYAFSISVPTDLGRVELRAPEYGGGRLDWDAFEVESVDTNVITPASDRVREQFLVTAIAYVGMPAPRWWEFEDARVDLGRSEAGDGELGRLLLAEFAFAWGNDWFQIPVSARLGALCRINELLVTDTFGVTTRIHAQALHSPSWRVGQLSQTGGNVDLRGFLLLPPIVPLGLESAPIERLRFVRDELANMAWAIEDTVATALGRRRALADEQASARRVFERPPSDAALHYQAMSDLPAQWIPLMPVREVPGGPLFLQRAGLLDELQGSAPTPAGALLSTPNFRVRDDELPRAGAIVTRSWQLARWHDGRRAVWLGRRKRSGAGELRSGLEYDRLLGSE